MGGKRRERVTYPPDLPDFAPSHHPWCQEDFGRLDFDLCIHVKHYVRGISFEIADELSLTDETGLRGIGKWTLNGVFGDCMHRFRRYIEANGDYLERISKAWWAESILHGRRRDVHGSVKQRLY
jgi:hypothetical protein